MEQSKTYDAFISYRNLPLDASIASAVQRLLETLHVVDQDGKKGHALRIFRDKSDLPATDDLSKDIEDALRNSRFLILICSRQYKESVWCMREVEMFRLFHDGTKHILPILIDGTPTECFPPCLFSEEINALGEVSQREPLAANICADSRLKMRIKLLSTEYLRLAAPIVGTPFAKLYQRKKRERIALSAIALSIIMAASIGFGIYNNRMLKKIEAKQQTIYAKEADRLADLSETELERQNYPLALMLAQRAVEYEIEAGNNPEENSAAGASLRSAVLQVEYEECNNIARTRFVIPYAEAIGDLGEGAVFRDGKVIAFCNLQTVSLYDTKTGALLFQTEGEYAALDPNAKVCVVSDTQGFRGYCVDSGECYFSWNPDVYIQSGTDDNATLIPIVNAEDNTAYLLTEVINGESFEYSIDLDLSAIVDADGQIHPCKSVPQDIDPGKDYTICEHYLRGADIVLDTFAPSDIDNVDVLELFEQNEWVIDSVQTNESLPFYIISYEKNRFTENNKRISESKIGIFDKSGEHDPYIFDGNSWPRQTFRYIGYNENCISFWYTSENNDYVHIAELSWDNSSEQKNQCTDALKSNGWSISGNNDSIKFVAADESKILTLSNSIYKLFSTESPNIQLLETQPASDGPYGSIDSLIQIDENLTHVIYANNDELNLWSNSKGVVFSNSVLNITSVGVRNDGEYAAAGSVSNAGEYLLHFYNADGFEVDTVRLDSIVYHIEIAGDYVLVYTQDEEQNGNYSFYHILQNGKLNYIRSIPPAGDFHYNILPYMLKENGLFLSYYAWDFLQLRQIYQVETGDIVFNCTCSHAFYNYETNTLIYEKGTSRQMTEGIDTVYAAQYDAEAKEFKPIYSILEPNGDIAAYSYPDSVSFSDSFFITKEYFDNTTTTTVYSIADGSEYLSLNENLLLRNKNLYASDDWFSCTFERFLGSVPIPINDSIDSLMQQADEYLTSSNGKREFSQSEKEMYYLIDY